MPRNNLKSLPTAVLRRGLTAFHPGRPNVIAQTIDPPGTEPIHPPALPETLDTGPAVAPKSSLELTEATSIA